MKHVFSITLTALVFLTGCSLNGYLGNEPSGKEKATAILFSSGSKAYTRAATGADAALTLGKGFVVEGVKLSVPDGASTASLNNVFDDYTVSWAANTAGTAPTNTSDWDYVGASNLKGEEQYVKYWDFAATLYNFAAYSKGASTGVTASDMDLTGTGWTNVVSPSTGAYALTGTPDQLVKCYVSDMFTAYAGTSYTSVSGFNGPFQNEVTLRFRSLGAKLRVGFYETIPGYSVKDLKFYSADGTADLTNVTLYNPSTAIYAKGKGSISVFFPNGGDGDNNSDGTDNVDEIDYNQAHLKFTPATAADISKDVSLATLDYQAAKEEDEVLAGPYLGRSSNEATFAGTSTNDYFISILPTGQAAELTLKVDYTLVSVDLSGETIEVKGATAVVPVNYTDWKHNFAYTYLFKISDNTNGSTGAGSTGLTALSFDGVVVEAEDGIQETITTLTNPAVTSYQKGKKVVNDHVAGQPIYLQLEGLSPAPVYANAKLYTIDAAHTATATENDVINSLQEIDLYAASIPSNQNWGRNGIQMTETTFDVVTEIPMFDGTSYAAKAAKIANPVAGTVYAFVYDYTTGTPTAKNVFYPYGLATQPTGTKDGWYEPKVWYFDPSGDHPVVGNPYAKTQGEGAPPDWLTANTWYSDSALTTPVVYFSKTLTEPVVASLMADWYEDAACTIALTAANNKAGMVAYRKDVPATQTYYKKEAFEGPTAPETEKLFYKRFVNNGRDYVVKVIRVQ